MATGTCTPEKDCCLCGSRDVKHLAGIEKKIRRDEDFEEVWYKFFAKEIPLNAAPFLFICKTCNGRLRNYGAFKQRANLSLERKLLTLQRKKRLQTTPPYSDQQQAKKKKNISTPERLQKSVEKLHLQKDASGNGYDDTGDGYDDTGNSYDDTGNSYDDTGNGYDDTGADQSASDDGDTPVEGIALLLLDHTYAKQAVVHKPDRIPEAASAVQNSRVSKAQDRYITEGDCDEISKILSISSDIIPNKLAFAISNVPRL